MNKDCFVIGGINIDIIATPEQKLIQQDSNPSTITVNIGGVGRNIASNLSYLGLSVEMISVIGQDQYTSMVMNDSQTVGYKLNHSLYKKNANSSVYMCINNHLGDMEIAVSDMKNYLDMTPDFFSNIITFINKSELLVIDTNIPQKSIEFLCANVTVPIFIDPVSTIKSQKVLNCFPYIHTIKPNKIEAEILSGVSITTQNDLENAAKKLLSKGIKNVVISLGQEGLFYATQNEMGIVPSHSPTTTIKIINTTGCGDAVMAGLIWGFSQGKNIREQVEIANIVASHSLLSVTAVNPELSGEKVQNIFKNKN